MFEVGRKYEFSTVELGPEGYVTLSSKGTVTKVDGNLIEINGYKILNVIAPTFAGAVDLDQRRKNLIERETRFLESDNPKDF